MRVSIVTSLGPGYEKYLEEAAASLCVQGVEVEWLVWVDGPDAGIRTEERSGLAVELIPGASPLAAALVGARNVVESAGGVVVVGAGARSHGSFVARNCALAHATSRFVVNLDADDTFHPGALRSLVDAQAESGRRWVVGHSTLSDGARIGRPVPDGLVSRGVVADMWLAARNPPLHPGAMLVDANLARALGGWAAMPAEGDTHLALAISEVAEGFAVDVPVLRYRTWEGQITRSGWRTRSDDDRYASMRARVIALRDVRLNG